MQNNHCLWRLVQWLQTCHTTIRKTAMGSVKGSSIIAVSVLEGRTAKALCKKLTQCGADQLTAPVLCGLTSAFVAGEESPVLFSFCGSCSKTGVCQRRTRRGVRLRASQSLGQEGSVSSILPAHKLRADLQKGTLHVGIM